MRFLRFAAVFLCVFLAAFGAARAQSVRYEEPSGSQSRAGNNAAEEQNRNDWPDIRGGETGTRVVLSADLRNADAVLYTNISYDLDRLLAQARTIAAAMCLPQTDFIAMRGRKSTNAVDLEFNDYLVKTGRDSSTFTLDLAALRDALEASHLSRPVTVFIKAEEDEITTATLLVPGQRSRRVTETFFALGEILDGATLRYETRVPVYGYVAAALFAGMCLMPAFLQVSMYKHNRKMREKRKSEANVPTIPDPATVQAEYDKGKPVWMAMLLPLLIAVPMMVLFLTGWFMRGMTAGFAVFQSLGVSFSLMPFAMMGVFAVAAGIRFLVERTEAKDVVASAPSADTDDTPPSWTIIAPVYPIFGAMFVMMYLVLFPNMRGMLLNLSPNGVYYFLGVIFMLALTASVLLSRYARRLTHYDLPSDHPAHRVIAELTEGTKVRVRKVEVVRSPTVNAYVNIFRTVGIASRMLREFSPDELRVIIAHEIGHFRASDPPRQVLFSLGISAALYGAWYGGTTWLAAHYPVSREAKALFASPIFFMVAAPLVQAALTGKASRRAEIAADRFAVDAVSGNGELVIATLTKLHTLNATPHALKPGDEAISTHPSLVNRIAAIRRYVESD